MGLYRFQKCRSISSLTLARLVLLRGFDRSLVFYFSWCVYLGLEIYQESWLSNLLEPSLELINSIVILHFFHAYGHRVFLILLRCLDQSFQYTGSGFMKGVISYSLKLRKRDCFAVCPSSAQLCPLWSFSDGWIRW